MIGAVLMDMIDITVVNVALPTIRSDLGASGTQLEWVVSAYMLAFAAVLIIAGSFGDLFGRKRAGLGLAAARGRPGHAGRARPDRGAPPAHPGRPAAADPAVPDPAFTAGLTVMLAFSAGLQGFFLIFAVWLQTGMRYSPLAAGLTALAFSAGSFLLAPAAVPLAQRYGRYVLCGGGLLLVAGIGTIRLGAGHVGTGTDPWPVVPGRLPSHTAAAR
jgi:MFS family permease